MTIKETFRPRRLMLAALAAVGMLIPATPAGAASGPYVASNSGGAYIRGGPAQNTAYFTYERNGTRLGIDCYTDGGWANGNYWTNRWFRTNVPSWRYGGSGYIHASLVAAQPRVPRC